MSASNALLAGTPRDARRFAWAFAAAAAAAIGAAALLPPPSAPRQHRFAEAPRSVADRTAATLERASAARPMDADALRRLADQLRASHRPLQLAVALERLHALTGDPAPLREAMDLRTDLGDAAAARTALERLSAIGATTEQEALRLAAARLEAGDPAGAGASLLQALGRYASPELALRAAQAAARLRDPSQALRPLGALLGANAPDLLEALRRVLMNDGRPDLALALMEGLPASVQTTPVTAFALAQAEARAGWAGSALARLLALRTTDGLPPGAGALLVDLALREGRLDEAFEVAGLLPPEAWPASMPMRLHEAARAAQRPELFRRIEPQRLAARPDAAAVVALARGDRAAARRFAEAGLARPPGTAEGSRGIAAVLRELGQDQAAHDRLRREAQAARTADPASLRLLAELAALPGRSVAALPLLERFRAEGAIAGEAWLRLALVEDRRADVAQFLRGGGTASPAALVETLTLAAQRRDTALAEAAAAALRGLELPEGWTSEEASVTAALARPLTPANLAAALDLLDWAAEVAARDRIVLLLASAPEIGGTAAAMSAAQHPAIARLRREAEAAAIPGAVGGETATARLALLAVLAPREAVPLLARRTEAEPGRFGPALVLARLRGEGVPQGEATLRALLPRLARPQQEQALFLVLAAGPTEAQPAMRRLAEETLGPNWRRSYEASLARQGRRGELVAALRARAALPGTTAEERREIAQRLVDLGERDAAQTILREGNEP